MIRTSFFDLFFIASLLASLSGQVSAQFAIGFGRGDVQASFVPVISSIATNSQADHTPLQVWPVPTTSTLQLDRVVTATIHDMGGQLVGRVARANVVDMGSLPYGAYLLRTEQGEVLRFIRE